MEINYLLLTYCPEASGQGVSGGFLWRLRYQDILGAGRPHDSIPSGAGSAVALPGHMVRGVEGVGACLSGVSGGNTWGIYAVNHD